MKALWSNLRDLLSVLFVGAFLLFAFIARFSGDTESAIWYLLLATFAVVACTVDRRA